MRHFTWGYGKLCLFAETDNRVEKKIPRQDYLLLPCTKKIQYSVPILLQTTRSRQHKFSCTGNLNDFRSTIYMTDATTFTPINHGKELLHTSLNHDFLIKFAPFGVVCMNPISTYSYVLKRSYFVER